MKKIKVLYVDDEPNNLASFRAEFRMDYQVLVAESAAAAEDLLKAHPDVHIILCDQRMPTESGVSFLSRIVQDYPFPVRMLVTGYTDIESVIEAINKGRVFRYIGKPWTTYDIKAAMEEGYVHYQSNAELHRRNNELQQAYDELDRFAHSITHDIRGPIVSVTGALQLVRSAPDKEAAEPVLAMMEDALGKLSNYISDVHDYYLIKRGGQQISEIDFQALADKVVSLLAFEGSMKGVTIDVQVSQPAVFSSDARALHIVLANLLGNAVKYQRDDNPDKRVSIAIAVVRNEATITVTDNGVGIPAAHHDAIFQLFYRASLNKEGSGFGLYNVDAALKKLGGNISLTSDIDRGTIFVATVPGL